MYFDLKGYVYYYYSEGWNGKPEPEELPNILLKEIEELKKEINELQNTISDLKKDIRDIEGGIYL